MRIVIRLLTAALMSCSAAVGAQEGVALPAPVAGYLDRGVAQGTWPQIVSAYLSGADSATGAYPATTASAPGDQRFLLGDAASVYTGLLLAQLASSGRVRLDDPISRFLPPGFVCADERVCALSLQQLAANDAGLPAMPANLFPGAADELWRDYRETDLLEFLANYRLPAAPVARASPFGQVLLAYVLGRAQGGGYAAALDERVVQPLGLRDTGVGTAGGVSGHRDGRSVPSNAAQTPLPVHVYSSANDLARLLRAMLRPGDSPLRAALLLSRQPRDARGTQGLGWRIDTVTQDEQTWPLVWRAGSAGGHTAFLGFRTDRQQAVAFLASAEDGLAPLGLALLGDGKIPPLPAREVALTVDAAEYAGLYEFSPGNQLLLRATNAGLTAQTSGRLPVRLKPLEADLFDAVGASVRLSFQRDALGRIDTLRWSENGVIVPVRRLSARAPVLPRAEQSITAETLQQYCGDYAVDADVLARFHCGARPTLQFSGALPRELFAYAPDRFASRDGEFELIARRDAAGKVEALSLMLLGSETALPRVHWQPLAPQFAATLQREQAVREESIRTVAAERAAAASTPSTATVAAPAPWVQSLPVLNTLAPYRSPGTSVRAQRATVPQPAVNADVPSSRVKGPATIRPAAAPAPARVEALPEQFERPRFTPARDGPDEEKKDDGT